MLFTLLIATAFSILATAIMSYIAMATATGPWIEPTLVFLGIIIFRLCWYKRPTLETNHAIGFVTIAGALGGIIAVACAWAFPTLFFLDAAQFTTLLHNPVAFCTMLAVTVLVAGGFGFCIAHYLEASLVYKQELAFPVGALVNKMIFAQEQTQKTVGLLLGVASSTVLNIAQRWFALMPAVVSVLPALRWGLVQIPALCVRLDLLPIFLSIGFITGHIIAVPLLIGLISKIACIDPIQRYFFAYLTPESFFLAFVTGVVLQGALHSVFEIPRILAKGIHALRDHHKTEQNTNQAFSLQQWLGVAGVCVLVLSCYFSYFHFSYIAQVYLILFTVVCTYQVVVIAGKTGLAPFPRFATFVLLPGMVFFRFDALQITIVSTFVEVCCAVAADVLFGRKMAVLSAMDKKKTVLFQAFGVLVSAASIGIIFYALIMKFGLGSAELFAQRAQARALLVAHQHIDYIVVLLGALFGFILRYVGVNFLLVIGGLLMPPELSLTLIAGGLCTYIVRDKEALNPFWSGVFAAGSMWMVLQAIV